MLRHILSSDLGTWNLTLSNSLSRTLSAPNFQICSNSSRKVSETSSSIRLNFCAAHMRMGRTRTIWPTAIRTTSRWFGRWLRRLAPTIAHLRRSDVSKTSRSPSSSPSMGRAPKPTKRSEARPTRGRCRELRAFPWSSSSLGRKHWIHWTMPTIQLG